MNNRQRKQLEFHESKENIIIGSEKDLPFDISIIDFDLLRGESYSGVLVEKIFDSGLTAIVYKLKHKNKYYNLKKKRTESLVKNIDGQASFLNEIQRRKDFEELRKTNEVIDSGVVKTVYANYRQGIMISDWIEGDKIREYNREIFRGLFDLTWNMEQNGIMEWDLCEGNLLLDKEGKIKLFDFGYMYTYDPLTEYNSEGKENPVFNSVERFETRAFMPYLLELEEKDREKVFQLYRTEKEEALRIFRIKKEWLENQKADQDLIVTCKSQIDIWEEGLSSEKALQRLYMIESTRSYVMDIADDISGRSCTMQTLMKIDRMIDMIKNHHDFMKNENGYLWEDVSLTQNELIRKYKEMREKAQEYQLI